MENHLLERRQLPRRTLTFFSFIYLVTTYSHDEKGLIYLTFAEYTVINEGTTLGRKCGVVVKEGTWEGDLEKEKGKTIF